MVGVRLHETGLVDLMQIVGVRTLIPITLVLLALTASAGAEAPKLPASQEVALQASVGNLYEAWAARRWRSMFKLLTPGDQKCGRVRDLAEELGGESGEWPVAWEILSIRSDPDSPHRKEPSDCSDKVWTVAAVAWVEMTATFEEPDGSRSTRESFENAWLLIDGKWYWSPSEL